MTPQSVRHLLHHLRVCLGRRSHFQDGISTRMLAGAKVPCHRAAPTRAANFPQKERDERAEAMTSFIISPSLRRDAPPRLPDSAAHTAQSWQKVGGTHKSVCDSRWGEQAMCISEGREFQAQRQRSGHVSFIFKQRSKEVGMAEEDTGRSRKGQRYQGPD